MKPISIKNKYHYFYKITNLINNHFYYGVHNTDNLDDGYMGSGTRLKFAYKKYGIECFKKEILKFFNSAKEAFEYEAEIVTEELVHNPDCYNIACGGGNWNTFGTTVVRDKDGNAFRVDVNDERLKTGELVGITKGLISVRDKNGNCFLVSKDDPRYVSGEVVACSKGLIRVKDKNGKYFMVSADDPRYVSGELIPYSKGLVTVKDKNGKYFMVSKDDPRYINGELKYFWTGRHHSKETIEKYHETFKRIKHQQGEKNSNYGKCWIMKNEQSICVPKSELQKYLDEGWQKGRKCGNDNYVNVNNGKEYKLIHKDKLQKYLDEGWQRGQGKKYYKRLENDIK